jgi:hypothetical protein
MLVIILSPFISAWNVFYVVESANLMNGIIWGPFSDVVKICKRKYEYSVISILCVRDYESNSVCCVDNEWGEQEEIQVQIRFGKTD